MSDTPAPPRPVMGIGSCLAGNAVRYDGESRRPSEYVSAICEAFEMRTFCPETGIGMGVPRKPIHLVGTREAVRALDVDTHDRDYTDDLAAYAGRVLEEAPELCGYILVKGSPSCGYERVRRFAANGRFVAADQQGIFAAALGRADPLLPLEDDGRLDDPGLRESFITRARAYHEWKQLRAEGLTAHRLVAFHSRYKYVVMAHDLPACRELGRLVVDAGRQPLEPLAQTYITRLMAGLTRRATRRNLL